jgi:RQC domain/HRDC domain/Helix-turn-helix domain
MKTMEVNGVNAVSGRTVNLTGQVKEVLKTLILLDKSYSATYVVKLVCGDHGNTWKDPKHMQLETFGILRETTQERVKNLIHYLAEIGFLQPRNVECFTIEITEKGRKYLETPWEIIVFPSRVNLGKFDYALRYKLQSLRTRLATETSKKVYEIWSDWAMDCMVRLRPTTLQDLKKVQGITPAKAETFGERVILAIKDVNELRWLDTLEKFKAQMKMPKAVEIKRLFLEGKSVADMAAAVELKASTIAYYLERLHIIGEINLRPWIELNMDAKVLFKASEYFRQVQIPRLKEAYECLGLDYASLRFGRLYVSDYAQNWDELPINA